MNSNYNEFPTGQSFYNANSPQVKTKRKQVKVACSNCKTSCKRCDENRPCTRCVSKGIGSACVDSVRKPRQKGIRRGPYKKRKESISQGVELPPISNLVNTIPKIHQQVQSGEYIYNPYYASPSSSISNNLSNSTYSSNNENKIPSIKSLLNEAKSDPSTLFNGNRGTIEQGRRFSDGENFLNKYTSSILPESYWNSQSPR